jgi:dihydrofolate synthase / folylpolyglutamate synthase
MPPVTTYQKAVEYLYALQKHGIKLGLANSEALMETAGRPHKRFRSVHIAGTNGKGSTAAFLAGILREAGYRTGLYTSPHLVSFTERIRVNGEPIPEDRVVALTGHIRERMPCEMNCTFFEFTTAVAFSHFAEEGVDIAVVETGMGGRLDSTNVLTPLVSVITNIEVEHTEFLGDTLELIAAEKAGIIKPAVPIVTGATQPEAIAVIEREAASKRASVYRVTKDFQPELSSSGAEPVFDYRGLRTAYRGLRLRLPGGHQAVNASLALAALECLREAGVASDERAVRRGLEDTRWEGRLERVSRRPDIYLDGAHNPAAAKTLAAAVSELRRSYRRLILVIGVLGDKDRRGILGELLPLADHVVTTKPAYSRAVDEHALAQEAGRIHASVSSADTVADALAEAKARASEDDCILVSGSLYVVGDARACLVAGVDRTQWPAGLKG